MLRRRFYTTFCFLLITSFVAAQWSSMHYHLSQDHSHDGGHHQHTVSAHSHQYDNHHADAIDVADDHLEHKVVELENECNSHSKKNGADNLDLQPASFSSFTKLIIPSQTHFAVDTHHQFNSYHYSSPPVRGPPTLS